MRQQSSGGDSLSRADTATDTEILRDKRNLVLGSDLDTELTHLDDGARPSGETERARDEGRASKDKGRGGRGSNLVSRLTSRKDMAYPSTAYATRPSGLEVIRYLA